MDNIEAVKSLLKKLSALRATIPDDEQLYLDKLIMGTVKVKLPVDPFEPTNITANKTASHQNPEQCNPTSPNPERRIAWNNDLEIYKLE
ncbi:MAG TPA: hypothetical protein PK205_06425 [Promineifilum sp.]|nr:hypothetical protein [Promineifilum sp.]HRO90826.1 hypothetical protein [Promineifilum sp.]HRQ12926.1 hypothetical protein [Promineifilum sp.]